MSAKNFVTSPRQFYLARNSRRARQCGGYNEKYAVYERTDSDLLRVAEFSVCTASYRGIETEAARALVATGVLPAEVLDTNGYFDSAYCTFETLSPSNNC